MRTLFIFPLLAFCMAGGTPPSPLFALFSPDQNEAPAQAPEGKPNLQERPETPVGPDYRIGPGDVLRVSVWEEPQLTANAIVVRPDGKISIPLVSDLMVAGMTPAAAEKLLTDGLVKFVKHPRVTIIVEEIHSRIVYVTGEVQHPGAYPMVGPMNVVQLISRAGGTTEFAKKKDVYVLHQDSGPRTKVNYQLVLEGKHLEENIGLAPGDTVVVP
jgi:polysaccharide export outer membrane protein